MAKPNRGKLLKKTAGWRGTCPACKRERVKVLWASEIDGAKVKICKKCNSSASKDAS